MGDAGHGVDVAGGNRVFKPHGIDRFDGLGHFDGVADIVLPVGFDAEVGIGAEFGTDGFHGLGDAAEILEGEAAGVAIVAGFLVIGIGFGRDAIALKLVGGPTELFGLCLLDEGFPGAHIFDVGRGLSGAVEADFIAEPAAKEIAAGSLQDTAGEIPEGDFDAAGGGDGNAALSARAGGEHEHLVVELVDVERVLADDVLFEEAEDNVLHARAPVGFADAGDAGVGFDLDVVPIPGAPDDHALDVGDFDLALVGGGKERTAIRVPPVYGICPTPRLRRAERGTRAEQPYRDRRG